MSHGSLFELKFGVEPLVDRDEPQPLLIYVPAERPQRTESPLAELENAGDTYEPQLKPGQRPSWPSRLGAGAGRQDDFEIRSLDAP